MLARNIPLLLKHAAKAEAPARLVDLATYNEEKTMSIKAHTATPYSLGTEYPSAAVHELMTEGGRWTELNAKDHGGFAFIVTGMTDGDDGGMAQATAEFIVRACNAHDSLVETLRLAIETIEAHQAFWSLSDLDSMKATLAKAGAQ